MPPCEELSVLDLLKVHVPRCPGCVQPVSTTACLDPQTDPALYDILTFVGALDETEEKPDVSTQPNSDGVSQTFFGISLDREVDSAVEHLACFVHSQVSPQKHKLESKKPTGLTPTHTDTSQNHSLHPAIKLLTCSPSPNTHQSPDVSSKQPSLITHSSRQAVQPSSQQNQFREVSVLSPGTHKSCQLTSKKQAGIFSPPCSNLELELHPSPSVFFKETQSEKLSTYDNTETQLTSQRIVEQPVIDSKVHKSETSKEPKKCQVKDDPGATSKTEKGSKSNKRDQIVNRRLYLTRDQETNHSTSPTTHEDKDSQANNDKARGHKAKADSVPSISKAKSGPGSSKDHTKPSSSSDKVQVKANKDLNKGQVKTGKHKEAETDQSSSRVKGGKNSSKDGKNDSGSRKDQQSKTVLVSQKNQDEGISRSSRGENKTYKLPFISTDEQENKDNEDPRWKEQARLSTNQERYRLAHRLWRAPCVPDPNRNLTSFGTVQLPIQHTPLSGGRRPLRKRWHEMDEEFQPPRKKQRMFEDIEFSLKQISRSRVTVMNQFLKTLAVPNISRHAAKKLESSHHEKQYMLDLACEEIKAIHQFYDGLPDQDLTITQEDVERGYQATEHVYQVFGDVYGYCGQEFFP